MRCARPLMLGVLTGALLLAFAAPALAADDGTVYGQAQMNSTLSLSISGRGSSAGTPLNFAGDPGDLVYSTPDEYPVITNNGTADIAGLTVAAGTVPTHNSSTWSYGSTAGSTTCVWEFKSSGYDGDWTVLPGSGSAVVSIGGTLTPGNFTDLYSRFTFPTTYAGGLYTMTAIVTATE